jgi:hypothetical protein
MSFKIWDWIAELAQHIEQQFANTGEPCQDISHEYTWYNAIYTSKQYRRAHVEIVDHRDSHGIYILHSTVFPHFNDPAPIWGFDAVCGPNKITGAFHDFSLPGYTDQPMSVWWCETTSKYQWNKSRNLPEWARRIFSPHMIAAGNINTTEEVDRLCDLARTSLHYYLENVGYSQESGADYHQLQNFYCQQQKLNPHVIKSMVAMGIPQQTMQTFVDQVLFPETY